MKNEEVTVREMAGLSIALPEWKGTKSKARKVVGELSEPEKMPGRAWGLSAKLCKRGSKLRKQKGTVCSKCYAHAGRNIFPKNRNAKARRLDRYWLRRWPVMMAKAIGNERWFRWFDTGDLQSVRMLERIVEVCRRTPNCRHWLATREVGMVREFLKKRKFPKNLTVRISADRIDGDIVESPVPGCVLATVTSKDEAEGAHNCPATFGDKSIQTCDEAGCRACWDRSVKRVNYKQH